MTGFGHAPIRVDQAFHGYDRGHRELAASLQLDEESRAVMLEFSDVLAGLDGAPGAASYLTCYPLRSASRHVLARTWPAGPGSRPGSVWTHSLVVDYQALARIADLLILQPLLRRSGELGRTGSLKPLQVDADGDADAAFGPELRAADAIEGLYGRCDDQVVVLRRERDADELLALALWRQMWPSMRREFSFVTGHDPRSQGPGTGWMLIFGNSGAVSAVPPSGPGLQALVDDLPSSQSTPLRRFLGRYAIEAPSPRRAVRALAELWTSPERDVTGRVAAVGDLVDRFQLRRLARDLVASEIDLAGHGDALLAIVEQFGDEPLEMDPARAVACAAAMDNRSFARLVTAASRSKPDRLGGRIFKTLVARSPLARVAAIADHLDRARLLGIREELFESLAFWPADDADRASLVASAPHLIANEGAWRMFGTGIGPRTAAALLAVDCLPPTHLLVDLLADGDEGMAAVLAERSLAVGAARSAALASGNTRAIRSLAKAQIRAGPPATSPAEWIAAAVRAGTDAPTSLLVVGLLASLDVGGPEGIDAAERLFDPVLRLARGYRLSKSQTAYVEAAAATLRCWNAADCIVRLALLQWPPSVTEAGALRLSHDYEGARDLVDHAVTTVGKASLEGGLADRRLPMQARWAIERRLKPPLLKFWWP